MIKNKNKEVVYLTFDIFKNDPIIAVHSTRVGGVSKGCFESMNLGFSRGDKKEDVLENYKLFAEAIQVPIEKMVLSSQWHHNHILDVKEKHHGMGIFKDRDYDDVDGLMTSKVELPLVTFYADCVPIYFYDTKRHVVAMTHSGWRGTASGIVKDLIDKWVLEGSEIAHIKAAIGPAVCKSCYEVTEEVIRAMDYEFASEYYTYYSEKNRYHIDLKGMNKSILKSCGLNDNQIEVTDYCTKCHPELFFSHRRHGNDRGTQIGVMMLKERNHE